ncbi:MAG: hypothetical protein LQ349_005300 [Xanthoria aureola]|nr:MAG: hypothetical protein LQ349_005300 [Xanthoria aureola]
MKVYDSLNRALEGIDPDTELATRMKIFDSESIMSLETLNLGVFRDGGVDDDGVFHSGIAGSGLSSALRNAFLGGVSSNCSMESICEPPAVCTQIGTRFTLDPQRPLSQSSWAYNVLTAIANINQQLSNQYQTLQSAAIESALATFNIADELAKAW